LIIEVTRPPVGEKLRLLVRCSDGRIYCVYVDPIREITALIGEMVVLSRRDRHVTCLGLQIRVRFGVDLQYSLGQTYEHDSFGTGTLQAIEKCKNDDDFILIVDFGN